MTITPTKLDDLPIIDMFSAEIIIIIFLFGTSNKSNFLSDFIYKGILEKLTVNKLHFCSFDLKDLLL